eukprot:a174805_1663.p1 GENE.a174805_1663~~a174805_1663.p1  ORF type:complete len:316 (+),score=59.29 a174805_1663:129-950(+)
MAGVKDVKLYRDSDVAVAVVDSEVVILSLSTGHEHLRLTLPRILGLHMDEFSEVSEDDDTPRFAVHLDTAIAVMSLVHPRIVGFVHDAPCNAESKLCVAGPGVLLFSREDRQHLALGVVSLADCALRELSDPVVLHRIELLRASFPSAKVAVRSNDSSVVRLVPLRDGHLALDDVSEFRTAAPVGATQCVSFDASCRFFALGSKGLIEIFEDDGERAAGLLAGLVNVVRKGKDPVTSLEIECDPVHISWDSDRIRVANADGTVTNNLWRAARR